MKAGETSLLKLMNGVQQFIVPIYQRTYSWTSKQCNQLWKDIIQITLSDNNKVHFIGSVVYIDLGTPKGRPQQLLLIDGQQRLATLSLLLAALARHIEDNNLGDQFGLSYFKETDTDYTDVIKRADEALYKSKEQGKSKVNILL